MTTTGTGVLRTLERTATIEVGQTQTYAFVYVFADNLDEVGAHEYFTVVVSSVSGDDATLGRNRGWPGRDC